MYSPCCGPRYLPAPHHLKRRRAPAAANGTRRSWSRRRTIFSNKKECPCGWTSTGACLLTSTTRYGPGSFVCSLFVFASPMRGNVTISPRPVDGRGRAERRYSGMLYVPKVPGLQELFAGGVSLWLSHCALVMVNDVLTCGWFAPSAQICSPVWRAYCPCHGRGRIHNVRMAGDSDRWTPMDQDV